MTRASIVAVLVLVGAAHPAPASAQSPPRSLQLTFEADGTVSLEAASVSTREVLLEWARLCGCVIVNAQNLQGTIDVPVSFQHKPQQMVLASLLRKASGYALTPRRPNMTGPSDFGTIYVLPTSQATPSAAYSVSQPTYTPVPPPTPGTPADEIPPITPLPTLPPQIPAAAPAPSPTPPASSLPGTPSRFVPIVPITSTGAPSTPNTTTSPATAAPGAPAPANPTGRTPVVTPR